MWSKSIQPQHWLPSEGHPLYRKEVYKLSKIVCVLLQTVSKLSDAPFIWNITDKKDSFIDQKLLYIQCWITFSLVLNCLITLKYLLQQNYISLALVITHHFVVFAMPHGMILIDCRVFQRNDSFVSRIVSFIGWSFSKLCLWHQLVTRSSQSDSAYVSHTWHDDVRRGCARAAVMWGRASVTVPELRKCAECKGGCSLEEPVSSCQTYSRGGVTIRVWSKPLSC